MLSSPIILYDYPQVAPESPGEMFDATEIDEILALRTMTLTDDEKAEARATDRHAAAIIDRVDTLPPEILDRLHGAVRYLRKSTAKATGEPENVPWWDPGADASVSPETDSLQIAGVSVAKGSRVRLCPGQRGADAQDMFLEGRLATVEAVFSDVDGNSHVAVTLVDDLAADLQRWHGRFLYFSPDEIEPLAAESLTGASSDSEKPSSRKLAPCFDPSTQLRTGKLSMNGEFFPHPTEKSDSCFDKAQHERKNLTLSDITPFTLRLSKGVRRVFQN